MTFLIHHIQHRMNALTIDVGYQQHSNYLINKGSKNKDSCMMDPPTTGIKRRWLGHESHLSTKEGSTVFVQYRCRVTCIQPHLQSQGTKCTATWLLRRCRGSRWDQKSTPYLKYLSSQICLHIIKRERKKNEWNTSGPAWEPSGSLHYVSERMRKNIYTFSLLRSSFYRLSL